jgi:hypothetical protein
VPSELARPSSGAVLASPGSDREFPRDPHVRVINADTGELIRELTSTPTRATSPPAAHPAGQRKHRVPDAGSLP